MQADAARAKESGNESLVALRDVLIRQARRMDKMAASARGHRERLRAALGEAEASAAAAEARCRDVSMIRVIEGARGLAAVDRVEPASPLTAFLVVTAPPFVFEKICGFVVAPAERSLSDCEAEGTDSEYGSEATDYSEQSRITATYYPDDEAPVQPNLDSFLGHPAEGASSGIEGILEAIDGIEAAERDPKKWDDDILVYTMKMHAYRQRNSHGRDRGDY